MQTCEPKVLIVDDDEDIRANVFDIFLEMGYQTSTAADGL
jgi:CheY-like chemotaxis protein